MLQFIGTVLAPATILTALLYYLGWTYNASVYGYFGIDQSALELSTQDYVLRSPIPVLWPMIVFMGVGLIWLWAHAAFIHSARSRRSRRLLGSATAIAGVLTLAGAMILARYHHHPPTFFEFVSTPVGLALGFALISYAVHLYLGPRNENSSNLSADLRKTNAIPSWLPRLSLTLVAVMVGLNLLWATANYADAMGRRRGLEIAADLGHRASVTVYSQERLHFGALGVHETVLTGANSTYKFRYTGLKLLTRSRSKYFLLPDDWGISDPVAIVLSDVDSIRVEFTRSVN